jgi:hypothetical protein
MIIEIVFKGEKIERYIVGQETVVKIEEHLPQFAGDLLWCDVYFKDNIIQRIFTILTIIYDN